MGLAK
jgi:putative cell wall-binding protein